MPKEKEVPRSLHAYPEYAAAAAKLTTLKNQAAALEDERTALATRLSALRELSQDAAALRKADLRDRALRLLNEGEGAGSLPEGEAELTRRIQELSAELTVLREAVRLQDQVVERVGGETSIRIAEALLPEHRSQVRRIADALVELARACEAELLFRDELEEGGVRYLTRLRAMGVPFVGDLFDRDSVVRAYLRECEDYGVALPALPELAAMEQLRREGRERELPALRRTRAREEQQQRGRSSAA